MEVYCVRIPFICQNDPAKSFIYKFPKSNLDTTSMDKLIQQAKTHFKLTNKNEYIM